MSMQRIVLFFLTSLLAACSAETVVTKAPPMPPVAKQVATPLGEGNMRRVDEFYWIRDDTRSDPEVLALLEAENDYTRAMMAGTEALQTTLFEEITRRLPARDSSVPVQNGAHWYYRAFEAGFEYPIFKRFKDAENPEHETVLNVNALAQNADYFSVQNWVVSPDDQYVAYAEDRVSRRVYTIKVRHINSQADLEDEIKGASPSIAWSSNGDYLFYIKKHPQTLLGNAVYRHKIGTPQALDTLVYEELDNTYSLWLTESRSDSFIYIIASSTESSEVLLIPRSEPLASPRAVLARSETHEYRVRHLGDQLYILTNWEAENYRLMRVPLKDSADQNQWQVFIEGRSDVFIEDFEVFTDHVVTQEMNAGAQRLMIYNKTGEVIQQIPVTDMPATLSLSANPNADSPLVRYEYSSLRSPDATVEFDTRTGDTRVLKEQKIAGGFNQDHYKTEYLSFAARDGQQVPISLVYKRSDQKEPRPAYLYAYGSYGYSTGAYFRSSIFSLLDRGFLYAIIHVRGGQELGRSWYEAGRLRQKKNTFNDFIDGSNFLVDQGLADGERLFAAGGSAGGLLMGVIANEAPERYQGIIAHVPFVDVITTMLDETIPLTTGEYREWGNPNNPDDYAYMLSYSPYDQIKAQDYPHMLVTTGLHDSQVQYFEPVKWVSRLRRLKTDEHDLLLDVDMKTGHSGSTGRYERYRKTALEYAFVLDHLD
ncbi:MAG: S9 family peptidase [Pseudomonadales bacterium]